jgi:hypothetical protein
MKGTTVLTDPTQIPARCHEIADRLTNAGVRPLPGHSDILFNAGRMIVGMAPADLQFESQAEALAYYAGVVQGGQGVLRTEVVFEQAENLNRWVVAVHLS